MTHRTKPARPRVRGAQPEVAYQLKVTLLDVKPPVWRRLLVPGTISLDRLHTVIQKAMEWTDAHLHEFVIQGRRYGPPDPEEPDARIRPESLMSLRQATPVQGLRFEYLYDFGDNWTHEVQVESIQVPEKELRHAVCLAGERRCPPEDCGGPAGCAEFLEAIRDPGHPQHREMLDWIGGAFDPDAFDLNAINRKLRLLK